MELQKEQQLILDTTNKDIIVSAGAGSGKTFVMIEKILKQIITQHTPVTKLLVVTFTNAAASEMRQRLEKRLREYLATLETDSQEYLYVLQQISLLPQSNISTLHKFCQNIIAKYFYVLDIDTSFSILEEADTAILYNRACDDILREAERAEEPGIVDLLYIYDNKRNNKKLRDMILRVYSYIKNLADVQTFYSKIMQSYDTNLDNNVFCKIIKEHIASRCKYYVNVFEEIEIASQQAGCAQLAQGATECKNVATILSAAKTFDEMLKILFGPMSSLSDVPSVKKEYEALKSEFQETKKAFSKELSDFREKYCITKDQKVLQEDLQSNKQVMQGIFTLVERFEKRYDELKAQRNAVDFSDLEHLCMQILSHEDIANEIKSSFDAVFVDEYQDINDIQEHIISCVQTEGNLFLVGDVKQSIYGFRNTTPQIFLDKTNDYQKDKDHKSAIFLNCNFRSDQRVLDFVNLVFSRLMTTKSAGVDYLNTSLMASDKQFLVENGLPCVEIDIINTHKEDKDQKIKPTKVYSVKEAEMEVVEDKDSPKSEADIIADKIFALLNNQKQIFDAKLGKDGGLRDINFGDISILCRNRSSFVQTLLARLRERGVPVEDFGEDDIFDTYEVQLLYNYLRLINNYQDDVALVVVLSSPVFNLSEKELYAIRQSAADKKYYYECLPYVKDAKLLNKLNKLYDMLDVSRQILINGTVYDCLNHFVQQTNLEAIISLLPQGEHRVYNMTLFINHFINRSYNTNLCQFIEFVQSNGDTLSIPKEDVTSGDIVHVTTMHHSKGLEYPIVFLVGLGEKFVKTNLQDEIVFYDQLGIGLYCYDYATRIKRKTLSRSGIKLKLQERALAENLRLLYVAMTRAKNHLYLIGSIDAEKFVPSLNTYDLILANNFLSLVLSALHEVSGNLHIGLKSVVSAVDVRNGNKKEMYNINVYPQAQHIFNNSELLTKPIKLGDYVPNFEQLMQDFAKFEYKYQQSTTIGLKNSVTSLNEQEADNITNVHEETVQFGLTEQKDFATSATLGTAYHHAMQFIDFNLDSPQEIYEYLSDKIDVNELKQLDCGKILSCLRNLRPLINGADRVLREQKFMMYVPHNVLTNSMITDKILVQGVVDLIVIKGDSATVVDYKLTNIQNAVKLKQKYAMQLHCYAFATAKALNKKVDKKILYSFLQEKPIIV